MALTILQNPETKQLFSSMAALFFDAVRERNGKQTIVALPGGRSIVGFLQTLREQGGVLTRGQWREIHFFMVDERVVPLDHPDSNYKLLSEQVFGAFVSSGLIEQSQLHPFCLDPSAKDYGVSSYGAELRKLGGRFHISCLGVGEDAHVGALFPQHHSFRDDTELFIWMPDSPKPPALRMSASRKLISGCDLAFGLFIGEAKRDALKLFMDPSKTAEICPAKLLMQIKHGVVVTDLPLAAG